MSSQKNPMFQQDENVYPPSYNNVSNTMNQPECLANNYPHYPIQPQFYQNQAANVIPQYSYRVPIEPVHRNYVVLENVPIARIDNPRYVMCQPTYMRTIDQNQINLDVNYPTCYVIFHCILTILLAIVQICAEFNNVDYNSGMAAMTSGWYLGGFMLACSMFTLFITCIRKMPLLRIALSFNMFSSLICLGFGIIVPGIDMSATCYDLNNYDIIDCNPVIINADIAKIIAAALAIKMYIIFNVVIMRVIRRHRLSASYAYVQHRNIIQTQAQAQPIIPQETDKVRNYASI